MITKTANSALNSIGRKLGNDIYKLLFKNNKKK